MIGPLRILWSQINLICLGDAKNAEASVATSGDGAPCVKSIPCDDGRWHPPHTRPTLVDAAAEVGGGELEKDEPTPG